MHLFDTIAAIATPVGFGGIAIVRLSGSDAVFISQKIVSLKSGGELSCLDSHKLALCTVHKIRNQGYIIDEALISVMRAPRSYTGEDVVEINCHGGYMAAQLILDEILRAGARPSEAGEFTRRAFINGKMDLTRAEAAADIIHANSELGLKNAANTSAGRLGNEINKIRNEIISLSSHLAAAADFPDEVEPLDDVEFISAALKIQNTIKDLINGAQTGKMLRNGIRTVILGRPNVGKSSLLNALVREDRAIVTHIAGTTRDVIEEYVNLRGIALRLVDTAGIREGRDEVEILGIERSISNIELADLILFVLDSSEDITSEDMKIATLLKGKNIILVINKIDISKGLLNSVKFNNPLELDISDICNKLGIEDTPAIFTSTPKTGAIKGISELEECIFQKFMIGNITDDKVYVSHERHRKSLIHAQNALNRLISGANEKLPRDLLSIDLEDAAAALGEIVGLTIQEEVIDEVFSKFCVGK